MIHAQLRSLTKLCTCDGSFVDDAELSHASNISEATASINTHVDSISLPSYDTELVCWLPKLCYKRAGRNICTTPRVMHKCCRVVRNCQEVYEAHDYGSYNQRYLPRKRAVFRIKKYHLRLRTNFFDCIPPNAHPQAFLMIAV